MTKKINTIKKKSEAAPSDRALGHKLTAGAPIRTIKKTKTIKPSDVDLRPPGLSDAEAAAKLAGQDRKPSDKKPAAPSVPQKTISGPKESADLALIADASTVRGVCAAWNMIMRRVPKWVLDQAEIDALAEALPPVIKKWLPAALEYGPESVAIGVLSGIILPRVFMTEAPPLTLPKIELPPERPPAPAPDVPAPGLDFQKLEAEAFANQRKP
jgi:hypothetical protein